MKSSLLHKTVFAAAGFLSLLVVLPAVSSLTGYQWPGELAFAAFHRVCHQDPAHSFHLAGAALPLCARCAGLLLGFLAGWAALAFLPPHLRNRPVSNLALAVFFLPLAVDGAMNLVGLLSTPSLPRFLTGFLFGAGAARSLWPALKQALSGLAAEFPRALER